jgi:hypothetical protein
MIGVPRVFRTIGTDACATEGEAPISDHADSKGLEIAEEPRGQFETAHPARASRWPFFQPLRRSLPAAGGRKRAPALGRNPSRTRAAPTRH